MKKIFYLVYILILSLISYGCDYCIQLEGRVLSSINGEPIRDAHVTLKSRNITVTTDSLGYFHLKECGGGSPPKAVYSIRKEGYKDFEIEFRSIGSGDAIIVKTGEKDYDLGGKAFYPDSTNLSTYHIITFEKYSKDFSKTGDGLVFYMDIDDDEIEFQNYLNRGLNTDRYKIQ
jgi:hypothetical protein